MFRKLRSLLYRPCVQWPGQGYAQISALAIFLLLLRSEENSGEEYPVTSSTVAGEPVCCERSAQDATVTTNVSDSGLEIRTEHWEKDSNEN